MSYTNKRPISPHLQIYNIFSKEMTSGPSFLNRFTGIGLAVGLLYLSAWLFSAAMGEYYYNIYLNFITSWFGYLSLFGLSACFFYHLINGIRFLIFDLGYWLSKKEVYLTGVGMILFVIIAMTITWSYIYLNYFNL